MHAPASNPSYITVARALSTDAATAAREAMAQMDLAATRFIIVFVPSHIDRTALARELDNITTDVPIYGCTTAGQITQRGYETDALLMIGFRKDHFRCLPLLIHPLSPHSTPKITALTEKYIAPHKPTSGWKRLGFVFTDGLSKQEDRLIATLKIALEGVPVFGGSAADSMAFEETQVLYEGRFHSNAALLLMLETNLEFQGFSIDHFLPSHVQLVITDANPEERIAHEINGAPAAKEYARLVGCSEAELGPEIFAQNPMLVQYQNTHYVRSVKDITDNQGLSFFAAIDDGLVMSLGRGKDVVENLRNGLQMHGANGSKPDFIIGFDCVLRKLELEFRQLTGVVSELFRENRVVGFNTFGEQYNGLHVNQTFVGIAFFDPDCKTLS